MPKKISSKFYNMIDIPVIGRPVIEHEFKTCNCDKLDCAICAGNLEKCITYDGVNDEIPTECPGKSMTKNQKHVKENQYLMNKKISKKLWAVTFKGLMKKLRNYMSTGDWVIKKKVTSAYIGYVCILEKRL